MYWTLNNFTHFLDFVSAVSGCVSIFAFAFLVSVPVGIRISAVKLKTFALSLLIEKYKSIIKKKGKKHDNIVLPAKTKLNIIKVLIFKVLVDSYINNDEFVSMTNVLTKCSKMKEEINNPKDASKYAI